MGRYSCGWLTFRISNTEGQRSMMKWELAEGFAYTCGESHSNILICFVKPCMLGLPAT